MFCAQLTTKDDVFKWEGVCIAGFCEGKDTRALVGVVERVRERKILSCSEHVMPSPGAVKVEGLVEQPGSVSCAVLL